MMSVDQLEGSHLVSYFLHDSANDFASVILGGPNAGLDVRSCFSYHPYLISAEKKHGGRMNQIEKDFFQLLDMGMDVLASVLTKISADDLELKPAGTELSMGELCRQMCDTAHAYTESFLSKDMDFELRAPERDGPSTGAEFATYLRQLETRMKEVIRSFSDDDLATVKIDREERWMVPPVLQFHIYREALLIFFGKLDVYVRMLNVERPVLWVRWVG